MVRLEAIVSIERRIARIDWPLPLFSWPLPFVDQDATPVTYDCIFCKRVSIQHIVKWSQST